MDKDLVSVFDAFYFDIRYNVIFFKNTHDWKNGEFYNWVLETFKEKLLF